MMQPMAMIPKLTDTTQTITFSEVDGVSAAEVVAQTVVVNTNAGSHNHGSSKMKLKNLVDYNWESKFYSGQLLALHLSGKYLAYAIKAPVNPGVFNGMVRVVYNPEPGTDWRALIKGMKGEVQDLSFAHMESQVILACIDEHGNFMVHQIDTTDSGLRCTLLAEVRENTGLVGAAHRVFWCPYIPDEDDAPDDDVARLLLTTHHNTARIWNMHQIISELRSRECRSDASSLLASKGVLVSSEHTAPVVDAAFSPDGTALATASSDGYVMFFQVYMHSAGAPRCLHKWQPHGGAPLSCLFFLDDHKTFNSDVQFWKYAITGADNNTTLKVWSCKSWSCLQTITLAPSPGVPPPALKARLDSTASCLLLADLTHRAMYVLHLPRTGGETGSEASECRNVALLTLPYPVLSFCIIDAVEETVKCESACDDPYHQNGSPDDGPGSPFINRDDDLDEAAVARSGGGVKRLRLQLYIVQPKGLQEGEVTVPLPAPPHTMDTMDTMRSLSNLSLNDEPSEPALASSILQQQSQQLKNLLMRSQTQPGSLIGQRPDSPPMPLNLMTPDAFSSPGKRDEDDPPLSRTPSIDVVSKPRLSTGGVRSGGSSPSREVQDIMSPNRYDQNEDDEIIIVSPLPDAPVVVATQNGADTLFARSESNISAEKAPKLNISNSETAWPQFSYAQFTEANQKSHKSAEKPPSQPPHQHRATSPLLPDAVDLKSRGMSDEDRAKIDSLEQKLDKLTELVTQQNRQLRALRETQQDPRELVEAAILAHAQRTGAEVENALAERWERIARIGTTAGERAATAAGVGAARALEPLAAALQRELAAKLQATDQLLRDNIDKLFNSKSVMEQLSSSIAASLADMVRASFREALAGGVLPAMDKAHQALFRQINHAFQQGTKEFAANTEAAARAAAERGGASAVTSLKQALDHHSEVLAANSGAPQQQQLAQAIRQATQAVLEKEMTWWREQARSVVMEMSRAHSPATPASSTTDRQMQVAQIQSLISSGDLNGAFQLALSASDLALVVGACKSVEASRVFAPPCRLRQHVLLSLVQQLAADMARDTQLKHRYLEEAIMNLDPANPVTREHLPTVVRELQKQIVPFLSAHPDHAMRRQLKMLLMAAESLVKGQL